MREIPAAYERLVRMHQAVAFRAAYLVTGDAPEAEDATQEAFIKAYRAMHRFRPGAPLPALAAHHRHQRGQEPPQVRGTPGKSEPPGGR